MTTAIEATATPHDAALPPDLDVLRAIERRVLWLATGIVDHANHARTTGSGMKVGGHQASSASMATIMTALWFGTLTAEDRVSVKPHASPVLHAVDYLLGALDRSYLTTLRAFGGLQSYPSRTKDPDPVDYSTGSVGIGATAPIWGAPARRHAYEPAFAQDLEWCLLRALGDVGKPGGSSNYFRLSTLPVDQALARVPADPAARERRRRLALAGGYVLNPEPLARVRIAAMGAAVPEALAAAGELGRLGHAAEVQCVTSADLLFRAARRTASPPGPGPLAQLFPPDRPLPLVAVADAHPHTVAFLGAACGARSAYVGVSELGQSGDLDAVRRHHGIDRAAIVDAALGLFA